MYCCLGMSHEYVCLFLVGSIVQQMSEEKEKVKKTL